MHSYEGTKTTVNCKVDWCNRFSECQMLHLTGLNCKKFSDLLCCKLASLLFELSTMTQEINYISLTTKTKVTHSTHIFRKKKTLLVSKILVLKHAWVPSLVHPHISKSLSTLDITRVMKIYQALPLLSGKSLGTRPFICTWVVDRTYNYIVA